MLALHLQHRRGCRVQFPRSTQWPEIRFSSLVAFCQTYFWLQGKLEQLIDKETQGSAFKTWRHWRHTTKGRGNSCAHATWMCSSHSTASQPQTIMRHVIGYLTNFCTMWSPADSPIDIVLNLFPNQVRPSNKSCIVQLSGKRICVPFRLFAQKQFVKLCRPG